MEAAGVSLPAMGASGVSLPGSAADCDYRQPSRYDDEVELRTRATLLSPIRIRFDYEVIRTGTILTTGHPVHAAIDVNGRPCRLPSRVVEMLAGRDFS